MNIPRFNSKLVRLKGDKAFFHFDCRCQFQFQTGSIKRPPTSRLRDTAKVLRFNSKLVRLKAMEKIREQNEKECFNSKLVRLKEITQPAWASQNCPSFNSKLVRLKVQAHIIRYAKKRFQFQTGSIKSATHHLFPVREKAFQFQTGSIKRQLTQVRPVEWCDCFNSKLVRLKALPCIPLMTETLSGFNSKLVRLKEQ